MAGSDSGRDGDSGHDAESAAAPNDNSERIFRSSLSGMFEESQSSKTDACALFCCGVYLWQRNQDILMRERRAENSFGAIDRSSSTPSSTSVSSKIKEQPLEALLIVLLLTMFVMWLFYDPRFNSPCHVLFVCAAALFVMCALWKVWKFQVTRKKLRREMAIAEYYRRRRATSNSDDNKDEDENDNDPDLAAFLEKHRQEIYGDGAHDLIGCARSNVRWFGSLFNRSENDRDDESEDESKGCCLNSWRCANNLFCGLLCGCHLQLFGTCATAQETRHLQKAIPASTKPHFWQRDYITMQPWKEYYPSILRLRLLRKVDFISHFEALSKLSRQILLAIAGALLFVTFTFLLPVRFPKWQILVLYATLLQPLVFLFFVHWMWNRLDLSLDAVVKYFACGFFVCTGCALVYEWIVSKIAIEFIALLVRFGSDVIQIFQEQDDSHLYRVHRPFWFQLTIASLQAFINAFIVAGLTEEICKYLCFWMVEHPDLEAYNKVILSSNPGLPESEEESSDCEDTEVTKLLSRNTSSTSSDPEQQEIIAPRLPLVNIGEAITVAMVTLALGFGCAENLLYIYVYTKPQLNAEIGTLYVRCLYPIHPMTAALQSIGVCRRCLERDSSVGVGRILLPALLLHGFFDIALMGYNSIEPVLEMHKYATQRHNNLGHPTLSEHENGDAVDPEGGDSILRFSFVIPFVGMMYYVYESNKQRERLEELDKQNRARR